MGNLSSHSITVFPPHSFCHGIYHLGLPAPPSLLAQFAVFWHVKSGTIAAIRDRCQVEGGGGEGAILDSSPVCSHHSLGSSDWEVSSRPLKNRKLKIVSQSDVLKGTINPSFSWTCSFFVKIRYIPLSRQLLPLHRMLPEEQLSNSWSSPNQKWILSAEPFSHTTRRSWPPLEKSLPWLNHFMPTEIQQPGPPKAVLACHAVMTSRCHF